MDSIKQKVKFKDIRKITLPRIVKRKTHRAIKNTSQKFPECFEDRMPIEVRESAPLRFEDVNRHEAGLYLAVTLHRDQVVQPTMEKVGQLELASPAN